MSASSVVPGASDLREVLVNVLENFAYLFAASGGTKPEGLDLSIRAALPGAGGWLVLRTNRRLAGMLAEAAGASADEGLEMDALTELCNLSASHLCSRLRSGAEEAWSPFVPLPGLPPGSPRATVLLEVEGQPLEAGFWSVA